MPIPIIYSLTIAIFCSLSLSMTAQEAICLDEVRQAGLRVVEITTVNGEEPQGEKISPPFAEDTYNFKYTNKVPCRIVITMQDDTLFDSGDYRETSSGATIRINGNTTAYYSDPLNMPYKLKFEKKVDLLQRGKDNIYADKHWRLLKDALSLNTIIGLHISRLLDMEWTAAFVPCNVVINGDYRGLYLLMETVRRNPLCRINTNATQGYIVERDPYWWKEDHYFVTSWYEKTNTYRWTWKYPDEELITDKKQLYIQNYINATENAIREGNYDNYIDIPSFAKWLLGHDILGTRDSGGSNMYFKKYDESDTTRLEMPCLWDFDSSYEVTAGSFSRLHISDNAYFKTLMQSRNRAFAHTYSNLWNEKKDLLTNNLPAFIDNYITSGEGKALDRSVSLYNKRFGYSYSGINTYANRARHWFNTHLPLLDKQIQLINTETSIDPCLTNTGKKPIGYYNLQGIQIHSSQLARQGIILVKYTDGTTGKHYNHEVTW